MCHLAVNLLRFFQASLHTFYAFRAQMVTAKLFSFQVCMCWIEPVFFKVADEKERNAAVQSGS